MREILKEKNTWANLVVMIKEWFNKACLPMLESVGDRPKQGLSINDMEGVQKMQTLD